MSAVVTGGRLRLVARIAAVVGVVLVVSSCQGTWGIRASYRNYVAGPIGGGEIVPVEGAGWQDGPGAGKGPFRWPVRWSEFDASTETGTVQMDGGVTTRAHRNASGVWLLDTTFRNPRLEIDGDEGTLYVDLNFRPFQGTNPDPVPNLRAAVGAAFATVDLSDVDWTPGVDGLHSIAMAPMVGVPATMDLIGWSALYGSPVTLDPLSLVFEPSAPTLAAAPSITVSQTEGLVAGDTITVWGSGFDPAAHAGGRPPLMGQPSGAYVVLGRFAEVWQPSQGAPAASRTVIAQRWALPEAQHLALDPTQTNPSFVRLDPTGRFTVTLTVAESSAAGNYGIYTYPGSGAVNATQELAQLLTLG